MHLTVGVMAVIGGAAVLLLRAVGYLRVGVPPAEDTYIDTPSGRRVKILAPENFGVAFNVALEVNFECADLDDALVSSIAAELLPIFSSQAEQRGLSLLRLNAAKMLPGWFIRRTVYNTRTYERQSDGSWSLVRSP